MRVNMTGSGRFPIARKSAAAVNQSALSATLQSRTKVADTCQKGGEEVDNGDPPSDCWIIAGTIGRYDVRLLQIWERLRTMPEPKLDARPALILIVEDEPLIRLTLAEGLRDAGFTVVEATNAGEAFAYIETGEPVDLVFSDIRMPGPLDGVGLALRLKAARPFLPVILASAVPETRNISDLAPFIQKPYRLSQVIARVVHALTSGNPHGPGG